MQSLPSPATYADLFALDDEALELRDGTWVEAGSFDETSAARVRPFDAIEVDVGRFFPPQGE